MALLNESLGQSDQTSGDLVLEISRRFSAPISVVFDAMTQPAIFKKWWGPMGCRCTECEVDLRVGGNWHTIIEETDGCDTNSVGGIYKEIDRPSKLVFTWAWTQADGTRGHETEVTILLHDEGVKTLMEFTQKVFADPEICQKHRFGWESAYDCLEDMIKAG